MSGWFPCRLQRKTKANLSHNRGIAGVDAFGDYTRVCMATNNLAAPRSAWPVAGTAVETSAGSGHHQFTDLNPATNATRYYLLRQP